MILFWIILFGIVTNQMATRYGVPYLFLSPEYFDNVSFLSYFIMGFACGGFIMAFNISSYVLNSYRFPFLATLYNPFAKYCINNSIIPALFILTYLYNIFVFQLGEQVFSVPAILILEGGFLLGVFVFIFLSVTYFFTINKDIYRMFGVKGQEPIKASEWHGNKRSDWKNLTLIKESRDWYVETYWTLPFVNRLVRPVNHYKKEMLRKVFKQNHRNAFLFILISIGTLFTLSFFKDVPFFVVPAASSVLLVFTMILMVSSAAYIYLRGWAFLLILGVFLIINSLYKLDAFNNTNKAYGLDYETVKAPYSNRAINALSCDSISKLRDVKLMIETLNAWKLKNVSHGHYKPKLVLINAPGGGLRACLWTFYALQYADSITHGELLKHTELISGSSGGMIGAAYLRELYLRKSTGQPVDLYSTFYRSNMGKDILNPITFSLAVNDVCFPLQKVVKGNSSYNKDRAYAFEWRLNQNTDSMLNKSLKDYKLAESKAIIPMMVFSPTIANDGRKLLIASQPISYLVQNSFTSNLKVNPLYDGIEFSRLFAKQNAGNVHFTSVLRMSATFPYVSPITSLPSDPALDVLDAGLRDNFGLEISLKYLYTFRNWITTNTSGVVIIQIRDKDKESPVEANPTKDIIDNLLVPTGLLYNNLFGIQDFNQNQLLQYASLWFDQQVEIVNLVMKRNKQDNISLSWHLTNKEKKQIFTSIALQENQQSFKRLKEVLDTSK